MTETRIFQIFRAGSHTTSAGAKLTFSENDLNRISTSFNTRNRRDAPLVIGHPENDRPAYGEVTQLIPEGSKLFAVANVSPGLVDMVRSGHYKKISAAFHSATDPRNPIPGYWYLRHVGFLGAQPPAVKGMAPLNFAETGGSLSMAAPSVDVVGFTEFDGHSEAEGSGGWPSCAVSIAQRVDYFQKVAPSLTYWRAYQLATHRP